MTGATRAALAPFALAAVFPFFPFASPLAQQFPSKPVRIIVPFPAAGAVDATTRIPGERLPARWGQPVIVDAGTASRRGGGVARGARAVHHA